MNKIWNELDKIKELPNLATVVFKGNEIYDKFPEGEGRLQVLKRIPHLNMIDGVMVIESERKKVEEAV